MRSLLILPLLSTLAVAQIPADTALVFEDTPLLDPYYRLVDVLGRGATQLREQNVFMSIASVATDPSTTGQFWFLGTASSLPGTWQAQIGLLAEFTQSQWGPWSQNPAERIEAGSNRIVTLGGGTVEAFLKVGNVPGTTLSVPQAVDIAIFGDLLYTAVGSLGLPAPVFENDLVTGTSRTVGSYVGTSSIAVSPTGSELCLGTQTGDLVRVDVATGAVTLTQATGIGAITAVGYTRFGTVVYTNGSTLWSELVPTAPIYTSATTILDFGVATATGAAVTPFGEGCGVAVQAEWSVNVLPTVGTAGFQLGVRNAPPTSVALLAVGGSRTQWTAAGAGLPFDLQPFGAAGCRLLVDPVAIAVRTTNSVGSTNQTLPIPANTSLIGLEFAGQWFVPDPTVGTFGLAGSEGVAFVIG